MAQRKHILVRLDPAVHEAIARWAADDLRSVNAQIEYALRLALARAGRPVRRTGHTAPSDDSSGDSCGDPSTASSGDSPGDSSGNAGEHTSTADSDAPGVSGPGAG